MKEKATYVSVSSPLEFKKFILGEAPTGWYRVDLLQKKLNEIESFRKQFTETELKQIFEIKEKHK